MLHDSDVVLNDALLSNLLVLDVHLQKDRADELPQLRLRRASHQVVEGVEEYGGDFALPQALVLADLRYLVQLHLN